MIKIKLIQLFKLLKSRKKLSLITLVVLMMITIVVIKSTQSKLKEIKIATVSRQDLTETISSSGEIKARKSTKLQFNTPSKIIWLGVEKGDQVQKWQSLASLDQRILNKNLKKKLLTYMNERWDFEQTDDDYDLNGKKTSQVSLTDEEKRIVEKAQFDLDSSILDVEISNLTLSEANLISPIAGTVTAIENIAVGENLTALGLSGSYIKIVNLTSFYFEAQVDEVDYAKIYLDQKVSIILDAFPEKTFEGTVSFISKEGVKTLTGGIIFTIEIDLNLDNNDLALNLSGDAEFIINQKQAVLVIPREFVKSKNGDSIVWIKENNRLVTKNVTTGFTSLTQTEILEGLEEHQEVVLVKNEKD
jgi:RND family efflux transporter MFP subunit